MLRRLFLLIQVMFVSTLLCGKEEITVGVTNAPPFIIIDDDEISGLTIDLWDNISDSLDIDYCF